MISCSNKTVRIYIMLFVLIIAGITYKVYQQVVFVKNQRRQIIHDFYDPNDDNISYADLLDSKFNDLRNNMRRITRIKGSIGKINLKQKVYNTRYLPPVNNSTTVIVIQVHSNLYLLKQLISSLRRAHSISNSLLIFSHDYYDNDINKMIHSITFAKYMQIFYPYTIQLHPNVFPGVDRNCQDGIICDKASVRDPSAAQMKHHWWWQMNQVFDNMEVTKNHTNTILFLEEDNYVTEDFIVVHKLLENVRSVHCPVCEMISLGAHNPDLDLYTEKKATITLEKWGENISKLGLAFDRSIWNKIKTWSRYFCYFNDYTWDNTLKYIGTKYLQSNFYITAIEAPRIFRVEKCDEKDISCKLAYRVDEVKNFIELIKNAMFPWVLVLKILPGEAYAVSPLGYFTDDRDHELCMYFTRNSVWY